MLKATDCFFMLKTHVVHVGQIVYNEYIFDYTGNCLRYSFTKVLKKEYKEIKHDTCSKFQTN